MKQSISDFLSKAEPSEVDELLSGIKVTAQDSFTSRRITVGTLQKAGLSSGADCEKKRLSPAVQRIIAAAAAFLVILGAVFGGGAYAEAKEYNSAKTYLDAHDISLDGLSHSDVKAVYKDISSGSFSLKSTAAAMRASYAKGYSQARREMDIGFYRAVGEDGIDDTFFLGEIYDDGSYYLNSRPYYEDKNGIHYATVDILNEKPASAEAGLTVSMSDTKYMSGIHKVRMGEYCWSYPLEDGESFWNQLALEDGMLFEVSKPYTSTSERPCEYSFSLIKLSFDGELIYRREHSIPGRLSHSAYIPDADGGYTLIGANGGSTGSSITPLEIYRFSKDGELIASIVPEMDPILPLYCTAKRFIGFNGGYAVLYEVDAIGAMARKSGEFECTSDTFVAFLDADGKLIRILECGAPLDRLLRENGEYFTASDICEFDGKLYVSGHYYKPLSSDYWNGLLERSATEDVFKSEAFSDARDTEQAALLVMDTETGELTEVLRIERSSAPYSPIGEISVNTLGELEFKTFSIEELYYIIDASGNVVYHDSTPFDTAYRCTFRCRMVCHRFDSSGNAPVSTETHALTLSGASIPDLYDRNAMSEEIWDYLYGE